MKMICGNKNIKIKIRSSQLNSNLSDSKLTEEKMMKEKGLTSGSVLMTTALKTRTMGAGKLIVLFRPSVSLTKTMK